MATGILVSLKFKEMEYPNKNIKNQYIDLRNIAKSPILSNEKFEAAIVVIISTKNKTNALSIDFLSVFTFPNKKIIGIIASALTKSCNVIVFLRCISNAFPKY